MKSVPWCRHGEKMRRHFYHLDVFTDKPLAGNPLAVITDGDGLSPRQMQAIAREMNLSETVFVQKPTGNRALARLRIFTTKRELPFAGHPVSTFHAPAAYVRKCWHSSGNLCHA